MGGEFWGTAVGTFIGLIVGAFVQYGAQRLFVRWQTKSLLEALKKEMRYNETVIDSLNDEVRNLKTAIGAQTLSTYYGYFKLTDVFFVVANKCLADAILYDALRDEDLIKLQKAASFFSVGTEQWVNKEIELHKGGKANPMAFADFLDGALRENQQRLHDVLRALKRVRVTFWGGPKPEL